MREHSWIKHFSRWVFVHAQSGFWIGAALGGLGRFVLELFEEQVSEHAFEAILHLMSATLLSATICACLMASLSTPAYFFRNSLWGKRIAIVASTFVLAVWTLILVLSWLSRILTGVFPSDVAVDMLLDSPSQFIHAGIQGAGLYVFMAIVAALAAVILLQQRLKRAQSNLGIQDFSRNQAAMYASTGVVAAILISTPYSNGLTPEMAWKELWFGQDVIEVRLVTSSEEAEGVDSEPRYQIPEVKAGPSLNEGKKWLNRVTNQPDKGSRPNVLLIVLESVPQSRMGYEGYERPLTVNIDRIAQHGWRARKLYTVSSQSNYAQPAILSSLLPIRQHRLDRYRRLDYPRFLYHDFFRSLGYVTATISSQNEDWQGMKRFQTTGSKPDYFFHSLDHMGPHIGSGKERKLPDHITTDVAIEWLSNQDAQRPWALYMNFQRTHFPYQLPDGVAAPYQPTEINGRFGYLHYPKSIRGSVINRYDNALQYVDAQVGRLYDFLVESEQLEDTLIVITSDHGETFHEDGLVTHGKTISEREIRVPTVLSWSGVLESKDIEIPISTLDILPTLAQLLEVEPHPSFQGSGFADKVRERSESGVREEKQAEKDIKRTAIFVRLQGLRKVDGVICWPWKLVADNTDQKLSLYRLDKDPLEYEDRFEDEIAIADVLLELLALQRDAQLVYHSREVREQPEHMHRYAPRLLQCPSANDLEQIAAEAKAEQAIGEANDEAPPIAG